KPKAPGPNLKLMRKGLIFALEQNKNIGSALAHAAVCVWIRPLPLPCDLPGKGARVVSAIAASALAVPALATRSRRSGQTPIPNHFDCYGTNRPCDGRQRQQSEPDRQPRGRSRNPPHPGWTSGGEFALSDIGIVARQGDRRAQGKNRVAPGRDLQ